jgi:hypothetical protein
MIPHKNRKPKNMHDFTLHITTGPSANHRHRREENATKKVVNGNYVCQYKELDIWSTKFLGFSK